MDAVRITQIALRRWYVLVPSLMLTALVVLGISQSLAPAYGATSRVLLRSPAVDPADPDARAVNPYLYFTGSLNVMAGTVVELVSSPDNRQEMEAAGLVSDFDAQLVGNLPMVSIRAQDEDEEAVLLTTRRLAEEVADELELIQEAAAVPGEQRIVAETLVMPEDAELLQGNRVRVLVVIAGLGVAASIGACLVVDAVVRRRDEDQIGQHGRQDERAGAPTRFPTSV